MKNKISMLITGDIVTRNFPPRDMFQVERMDKVKGVWVAWATNTSVPGHSVALYDADLNPTPSAYPHMKPIPPAFTVSRLGIDLFCDDVRTGAV